MIKKTKNNKLKLLLLASYTNNLGWAIYSPLYALYVLKLGGTAFDVSILWGMYALIAGLLMMFFGNLEDHPKYNPGRMLVIGYGLFILVGAGLFLATDVSHFYVVQGLLAVAMGIMTPASRMTFAKAQTKGKEAGQWGVFDGGNYLLIAAASITGGFIFKIGDFKLVFASMILIQTVATFVAYQHYRLAHKNKLNKRTYVANAA